MRLFTDVATRIDDPFLARAYSLAEEGRGTTSPNPLVGCVIVRDGAIVGEGFHERAGGPHAEVVALAAAGDAAAGATAYVTLEPCNHYGRTPPCSLALEDAGVSSVLIGMPDPSDVAGGGAAHLRHAGIDVRYAADPSPFAELNEAWLHHLVTKRPYVQVKVALTLDGRMAAREGLRSRISGQASSALTMRLRAAADAVLVGAGTAACDQPALTVRTTGPGPAVAPARQPLRVVLGRSAVPDCELFHDGAGRAIALAGDATRVPDGVEALRYRAAGQGPAAELIGALHALAGEGVRRLLVEPGPRLFGALLDAGLIDELTVICAGGVFGEGAPGLYPGITESGAGCELERSFEAVEAGIIGGDAVSVWRPVNDTGKAARGAAEGDRACSPV